MTMPAFPSASTAASYALVKGIVARVIGDSNSASLTKGV